jgi:hypothetical protein
MYIKKISPQAAPGGKTAILILKNCTLLEIVYKYLIQMILFWIGI